MATESLKQTEHQVNLPSKPNRSTKLAQKKRKKSNQDKPQPSGLVPPDHETPVLNPKSKPEAQHKKEKPAQVEPVELLPYKSDGTLKKAPPPGLLLTLVGAFLSSYGFDGASQLYTDHCVARKKLQAWDHELGAKLPEGMPDLVKLFKEWYKEWETKTQDESNSTSSEEVDSHKGKPNLSEAVKTSSVAAKKKVEAASTSESDESSSEDDSLDSEPQKSKPLKALKKAVKRVAFTSSSSSSSSDSDADDEKPAAAGAKAEKRPVEAASSSDSSTGSDSDVDGEKGTSSAKLSSSKPTVNDSVNKLKRKASASSSPSDSESSSSSSDYDSPPPKKSKVGSGRKTTSPVNPTTINQTSSTTSKQVKLGKGKKSATSSSSEDSTSESGSDGKSPAQKQLSDSSSSSSEDSSSSSDSEAPAPTKPSEELKPAKTKLPVTQFSAPSKSSDSSVTLDGAVAAKPLAQQSTVITTSATPAAKTDARGKGKRKRSLSPHSTRAAMTPNKAVKKDITHFQRVPKDTKIDPKLSSNKYVNYDYAERAHRDLSVMKGKGFMKEKNKKKRGSYRGGTIDVDGRKGIKFDS
ncbi:MAG: hypothetical protein Q9191_006634 [Dirinaria sp. TL-2023a]